MGIGDELMMAGEARRRAASASSKFAMLDRLGGAKWHFIWDSTAHVARPGEPHEGAVGYVDGRRPYCVDKTAERWVWRPYQPTPAALLPFPETMAKLTEATRGAVVFNPTIKSGASPNKQWGLHRWKQLLRTLSAQYRMVQIGDAASPQFFAAERVVTRNFVEAMAALAGSRAAILHEGGLHHAAAALGVPAVVIYGGYISPRVTGYEGQRALFMEDREWPLGCGSRIFCRHCDAAMEAIKPDAVAKTLRELLAERKAA